MPYSPSSYGYTPLTLSDFSGQAYVPSFQSIMGTSFPDLATTLSNLAIARRAPLLAEQGREFDVTSGNQRREFDVTSAMQQQSLQAQLEAMRQQLAQAQQQQAYLQTAVNDPFSHYQTLSSLYGGGGGGRGYSTVGGSASPNAVHYIGRNMLAVPASNWTGTYWEDPMGNAHYGNPIF